MISVRNAAIVGCKRAPLSTLASSAKEYFQTPSRHAMNAFACAAQNKKAAQPKLSGRALCANYTQKYGELRRLSALVVDDGLKCGGKGGHCVGEPNDAVLNTT